MTYGFIISAGSQTRFKSETPKALVNINGETLLDRNIKAMFRYVDKVVLITSLDNYLLFPRSDNRIINIPIRSGQGCGDAVLKGIQNFVHDETDTCFIKWGDSLHDKEDIYQEMLSHYTGNFLIPAVYEEKPYVQIKKVDDNHVHVNFSKYDEVDGPGYHDLSIFYGNLLSTYNALLELASKFKKDGAYKCEHGNELTFLDIFNYTNIPVSILDMKDYKDFSFNTVEQLKNLLGEKK
jgi:molybdopterin-guanine dinucleotide biosynthesis protein A